MPARVEDAGRIEGRLEPARELASSAGAPAAGTPRRAARTCGSAPRTSVAWPPVRRRRAARMSRRRRRRSAAPRSRRGRRPSRRTQRASHARADAAATQLGAVASARVEMRQTRARCGSASGASVANCAPERRGCLAARRRRTAPKRFRSRLQPPRAIGDRGGESPRCGRSVRAPAPSSAAGRCAAPVTSKGEAERRAQRPTARSSSSPCSTSVATPPAAAAP